MTLLAFARTLLRRPDPSRPLVAPARFVPSEAPQGEVQEPTRHTAADRLRDATDRVQRRKIQIGRLQRRIRRASAALEDDLVALHRADAALDSERESAVTH